MVRALLIIRKLWQQVHLAANPQNDWDSAYMGDGYTESHFLGSLFPFRLGQWTWNNTGCLAF